MIPGPGFNVPSRMRSAGANVEGGDVLAGFGDQHRRQTLLPVVAPGGVGGIGYGLGVTVVDAMVVGVSVDDRGAAVPQLQGRGLLPGLREAVNIDQLRRIVTVNRPGFGSDPVEGELEHAQEVQPRVA